MNVPEDSMQSPEPDFLPDLPTPFVKLTDFGLSRFIDPASPYLETRCGSEEYAAPELIMGKRYDGRQTDSWALGVVLYALTTGFLPFIEGSEPLNGRASPYRNGTSPAPKGSTKSRRNYLVRIAKGEYSWPEPAEEPQVNGKSDDATRLVSEPLKKLVEALLCREPKLRARAEDVWDFPWLDGPGRPAKRSISGGDLEGVSVAAFGREDGEAVRSEVPNVG